MCLDLLCDCQKSQQESRSLIQGCLSCIRNILPYISNDNAYENGTTSCEHLLQVNFAICFKIKRITILTNNVSGLRALFTIR